MNHIFTTAKLEIHKMFRDKIFLIPAALIILIAFISIITSTETLNKQSIQRKIATDTMRDKFLNQGEINPHSAAHYGHFVYKPISFLSIFDPGVDAYTGTSILLEGHRQNESRFSQSQEMSSLGRLGSISFALLLQIIVPLLLVFTAHDSVASEKTNGTFKLLIAQGISKKSILAGKISGLLSIALLFLTVSILLLIIAGVITGLSQNIPEFPLRILIIWLVYGLYYGIIITLTIYLSAKSGKANLTLIVGIFAWFLLTILMPKLSADIGEKTNPLLSKTTFQANIDEDNKNGINGHDPKSDRVEALRKEILKTYNVDSLSQLKINADGIIMQEDENYHNKVYDKHFADLKSTVVAQNSVSSTLSLINPFLALRNLSLSLSLTDTESYFNFKESAEEYRRILIKKLNDEMAFGGSKTGDWDWAVNEAYWKTIDDYKYTHPTLLSTIKNCKTEIISLILWSLICVVLIFRSNKSIKTVQHD